MKIIGIFYKVNIFIRLVVAIHPAFGDLHLSSMSQQCETVLFESYSQSHCLITNVAACLLHSHYQNDCIQVGSCVSHFNVSLIVRAKSQDSVHKPRFLKRRERRAKADRIEVLLLTSQAPYCQATPAHV